MQNCLNIHKKLITSLLAAWCDVENALGLETVFQSLFDDGLHATHVFIRRVRARSDEAVFDLEAEQNIVVKVSTNR